MGMQHRMQRGFTLIELMIVVAVIGILAAIGYPSYSDYIRRGKIAEAASALSDWRTKMETYYLDNRNYGPGACGVATPPGGGLKYFTYTCALSNGGQGFTLTATGVAAQGMAPFVYTIDNTNLRATVVTSDPRGWTSNASCWVTKKGGIC
jgi:prepilin-type N-terminal cleavage/methylation domain-containing protein